MKEILAQIKQYKKDSILTPIFTALEVFMEMLLPFIMAKIIDDGIEKGNMTNVYIFGGVMVVAAMVSLLSGFLGCYYLLVTLVIITALIGEISSCTELFYKP